MDDIYTRLHEGIVSDGALSPWAVERWGDHAISAADAYVLVNGAKILVEWLARLHLGIARKGHGYQQIGPASEGFSYIRREDNIYHWFNAANIVDITLAALDALFVNVMHEVGIHAALGVVDAPTDEYHGYQYAHAPIHRVLWAEFDGDTMFDGINDLPTPNLVVPTAPFDQRRVHVYWLLSDTWADDPQLRGDSEGRRRLLGLADSLDNADGQAVRTKHLRAPGSLHSKPQRDRHWLVPANFPYPHHVHINPCAVHGLERFPLRARPEPLPAPPIRTQLDAGPVIPYVAAAIEDAIQQVSGAPPGQRTAALAKEGFSLGTLVGAGVLDKATAIEHLTHAAVAAGIDGGEQYARYQALRTVEGGMQHPRDLGDVARARVMDYYTRKDT